MTDGPPRDIDVVIGVVILAPRATSADHDRVATMVESARSLAGYVVVVVPKGWRAPPRSRVVHVAPGVSAIGAIRAGMAQLSNTPAPYALLWPLEAGAVDVARLRVLVADVARKRPAVGALAGDDVEHAPVMVARDAWLDLMTLGEQGIGAVAERRGVHRVAGDVT
jgi:hypothetical protein